MYDYGKRYHNDKFVGWATWKVHPNCLCARCPNTVAEFFGKKAKTYAKDFAAKLNRETIQG